MCEHITEERWQACIGRARQLQVYNSAKHRIKDFSPSHDELLTDYCRRSDQNWAELRCEGKIDPKQFAHGTWASRWRRKWRVDVRTQPCLIPLVIGKGSERSLLRLSWPRWSSCSWMIIFKIFGEQPSRSRICHILP